VAVPFRAHANRVLAGAEIIKGADPAVASPKPAEPELPFDPTKPLPEVQFATSPAFMKRRKFRRDRMKNRIAIIRVLSGLDEVDALIYDLADLFGVDPASPFAAFHSLISIDVIPQNLGHVVRLRRVLDG
jgi:hypothetical protein